MAAIWLLLEVDPDWLEQRSDAWWERWHWYLLRGLSLWYSDEPKEPKHLLFEKICKRTGDSVRLIVIELSKSDTSDSRHWFQELIELCGNVQNPQLDTLLRNKLNEGSIGPDRVSEVARFLLARDREPTLACCRLILSKAGDFTEVLVTSIAAALLDDPTSATWSSALSFLRDHPDLAGTTLKKYATLRKTGPSDEDPKPGRVTESQIGELIAILFEHFPPESDPVHDGVYLATDVDSAVMLRSQLLSNLDARKSVSALVALQELEAKLGGKYPWIRRARSTVQRAYRRSNWNSVAPEIVAHLLVSNDKRLIRSEADAVDGIIAAIQQFEHGLRYESPPMLEDLWNMPTGGKPPTPKTEERISDKLCGAVRRYFADRAVTADREVQIRRRYRPESDGGEPGSRADILFSVPAQGAEAGEPIVVPIEVKRSDNREAKNTGLPEQLFARYMSQTGTGAGVFVVVWLGHVATHKPVWNDIDEAKRDLEDQIQTIRSASNEVQIAVTVVDASLP